MENHAPRLKIRSYLVGLALVLVLAGPATWTARAQVADEYRVKAAYLYNFTKFVEWPEQAFSGPDAPLMFCVAGDDPFGDALDALGTKIAKGRKITVKRLGGAGSNACHVLFIAIEDADRIDSIVSSFKGSPVLIVGDSERFIRRGGMIGFFNERNKVVFEINDTAAKKAGLRISSQLLSLARTVH